MRRPLRVGRGAAEAAALGVLAAVLLLAHLAFLRQDQGPPLWDEALHLLLAARFHDFLQAPSRRALEDLREAWSFYPPLYHAAVGALFRAMGLSTVAARVVNLILLGVLGAGTCAAGAVLFGRRAGAVAAGLVVTFPIVTQLARMAMTDLALAAFVAASVGFLLATDLRWRRQATVLGLLLAAGLMTKWIFPAFVVGPLAVWAATRARRADVPWLRRLGLAAAVAALAAGPWYALNAGTIVTRGRYLAGLGPAQGNPYGWTWANATVYGRVVLDAFVAAPVRLVLIGAALAALACLVAGLRPATPRPDADPKRFGTAAALVLIASWLVVPYVAMTAISNKDPRFVLPMVGPLAVLGAWGLLAIPSGTIRRAVLAVIAAYLAGLYVLAVAAPPSRERALARLAWAPGLAQALRLDLQHLAPPPDPGWPSAAVVEALHGGLTPVAAWASLEVVPDLSTVNPNTLTWLARRAGFRLKAHHPRDPAEVDGAAWEYVLLKPEGGQGAAHTTQASAAITERVLAQPEAFVPVADFAGPDGATLRLLRTRASLPPPDLRTRAIELASPLARWHLGGGWGQAEPEGRWALGNEATVRIQLDAGRAYRLRVHLSPFPRLPQPQVVTASFRGEPLATDWPPLGPGVVVLHADIPASLPSGGIDELRLGFVLSARPSELGLSADSRPLAAYVRRIVFAPQ